MLAMADKHGRVWGALPGLANRARVPVEVAREAHKMFLTADIFRTKDHQGAANSRSTADGVLLNHGKYRSIRDEGTSRLQGSKRALSEGARGKVPRGQNTWTKWDKRGQLWTRNGHNAEAEALNKYKYTPLPQIHADDRKRQRGR